MANLLSKETYLRILEQAEILPEGFEVQDELDKLEAQAPDLAPIPPRGPAKPKKATVTRPDGSTSTIEME